MFFADQRLLNERLANGWIEADGSNLTITKCLPKETNKLYC